MTANQLAYQANLETARANRAKEQETNRHNLTDEYNQWLRAIGNPISALSHIAGLSRIPGHDGSISGIMENYTDTLKDAANAIWGMDESERKSVLSKILSIFSDSNKNGHSSNQKDGSFYESSLDDSNLSRGGIFR